MHCRRGRSSELSAIGGQLSAIRRCGRFPASIYTFEITALPVSSCLRGSSSGHAERSEASGGSPAGSEVADGNSYFFL